MRIAEVTTGRVVYYVDENLPYPAVVSGVVSAVNGNLCVVNGKRMGIAEVHDHGYFLYRALVLALEQRMKLTTAALEHARSELEWTRKLVEKQ